MDAAVDLSVDVCVVGAGPAGLSVASALAGARCSVLVVEAGGDAPDTRRLAPTRCSADNPYPGGDVDSSHAAMLGGTAGLWSFQMRASGDALGVGEQGCRYAPLQPLDFEARPDVGTPGWDLPASALDPWYAAAHELAGLGSGRYDVQTWTGGDGLSPLPLSETDVETSMFQFGPASVWTDDVRARLEAAPNVGLWTSTVAVRLEPRAETSDVGRVVVHDGRRERRVSARVVVLAAGGLETVRLLLDSQRAAPGWAPGDANGLVGRYFMEHPLVRGGLLVTQRGDRVFDRLGLHGTRRVDGTYVTAKLTLREEVVVREGLVATSALLVPRDRAFGTPGAQALARLRSPSGHRDPAGVRLRNAGRVLAGARDIGRAVRVSRRMPSIDRADWVGAARPDWTVFELLHQTEQTPDPDNRVTLTGEVDALGRSGLDLRWTWSTADQDRVARARDHYAAAFEQVGLGRVVGTDYDAGRPRLLTGTHHHMGTTRLSADPAAGVVDPDGRVHGTPNLFVAGSSIFPSGGFVNPTLTVVALALRLGSALRGRLAGAVEVRLPLLAPAPRPVADGAPTVVAERGSTD